MRNFLRAILDNRNGGKLSQYLAVLSANLAIFITGIHVGWTSPALKILMSDAYPFEISEEEGSYIAIIAFGGDIIGGISACYLIDRLGRRNTLLSVAIPFFASFLLIALSNHGTAFLYCARVLGGIGEGATYAVIPMYAAEVADPDIRGKLGLMQIIIMAIGQVFINIISEYMTIPAVATICLIFPIIYVLIFANMPETPYFLLSKQRTVAAMESLKTLRRSNNVDKEFNVLESDVQRQMSEQGGFRELFSIPANRKALILANTTRFFQQMTGCTAFGSYYQLLVAKASNISPMISTSALLIFQVAVTLISSRFIDTRGRKPLLVLSASSSSLVLFAFGIFMILKDFTSVDTSGLEWIPLALLFIFVVTFIMGYGAVPNILTAEMYSTSIKAKATLFSSVSLSCMMLGSTKFYQYTTDNISQAVPFLTFSIFTFISTFFCHFVLIETKGKTLEMIQQELIAKSTNIKFK